MTYHLDRILEKTQLPIELCEEIREAYYIDFLEESNRKTENHRHPVSSVDVTTRNQPFEKNKELIDYLKKSRLFSAFPMEYIQELIPHSDIHIFPENTEILTQNQPNDRLFFIMEGEVGIYVDGEFIIDLKRNGDILGEMSIISEKNCSATAITHKPTKLFIINAKYIGNYKELNSKNTLLNHVIYRAFAMILTEKLYLTTEKAKQFEIANKKLEAASRRLEESYLEIQNQMQEKDKILQEFEAHKKKLEHLVQIQTASYRNAKDKAEQASLAKSIFIANISHEIKTPLHHVLAYSAFGLKKSTSIESEIHKYFETIQKSGNRLLLLLNDIIEISKYETGDVESDFKINDLLQTVLDVKSEFDHQLTEKNLTCIVQKPVFDLNLEFDRRKIKMAFSNLLSNAIKFSEAGKTITVYFNQEPIKDSFNPNLQRNGVRTNIKDQGIGIPFEEKEIILKPFNESSRSASGAGGTGLGLAICDRIIQFHYGSLRIEDNPEPTGAIVSFVLPVKRIYD